MEANLSNRLLLSDATGIKPSSSNYRDLLSSSFKYGLTDGTEKASEILLTELGVRATSSADRIKALREAALMRADEKSTHVNPATAGATPAEQADSTLPPASAEHPGPKPIVLGHGKDKVPLQKLQAILTAFQIPHRVTLEEAHLGRPISQKRFV